MCASKLFLWFRNYVKIVQSVMKNGKKKKHYCVVPLNGIVGRIYLGWGIKADLSEQVKFRTLQRTECTFLEVWARHCAPSTIHSSSVFLSKLYYLCFKVVVLMSVHLYLHEFTHQTQSWMIGSCFRNIDLRNPWRPSLNWCLPNVTGNVLQCLLCLFLSRYTVQAWPHQLK